MGLDLLLLVFIVICLYGTKTVILKNEYYDDYISPNTTNVWRGIFAIVVVFHHISNRYGDQSMIFRLFEDLGPLAVSFFFFLSGYSLQYKWAMDENYKTGFLRKKLRGLLSIYLIMNAVFWFLHFINGNFIRFVDLIGTFIKGDPLVSYSWYIVIIIAFYIIFDVEMLLFGRNYKCNWIFIFFICLIWSYVAKNCLVFDKYWYQRMFSLPLGMFWAVHRDEITIFFKKHYYSFLVLFSALFVCLYYLPVFINGNLKSLELETYLMCLIFPVIILLVSMKFKFNNKILVFLGHYSLEIYLCQGIMFYIFDKKILIINNFLIYGLTITLGTILLAYLVNKLTKLIFK